MRYTEDEQIVLYSMRAFLNSPIQISSNLEEIDDFELSLYCNEEVIAINQDSAFCTAKPYMMLEDGKKIIHVFKKRLAGGDYAISIFNLGETIEDVKVYLEKNSEIRDVWAKKDMEAGESILVNMHPHTVRIFRVSEIQ